MKKPLFFTIVAALMSVIPVFSSCSLFYPTWCNVSYEYNGETVSVSAKRGSYYSLETVPEKYGYTFEGLFDEDGRQQVSAEGHSLEPFKFKNDVVFYARFKPIEYSISLDYGGAATQNGGTFNAEYDGTLPQLPAGLTLEGKTFAGWFTAPDCGGLRVCGADGISQAVVNENNFDLGGGEIKLYAGFETIMFTITCRDASGSVIATVQAEYGSPVAVAANSVRVNGLGVLRWQGGTDGKVTKDTELIAEEYAPVIELDLCGGKGAAEVIALAGSTVRLPVPQKEACDFLYWADGTGKKYTSTVMPANGIRLTAVWQPKIVFDGNGGSEIEEIVKPAGSAVVLPYPTR